MIDIVVRRPAFAALAAGLLITAACGGTPPAGPSARPEQSLTVFAASSLTEAFGRIGSRFEAAHPGTTVTFSFGSSATLAAQITQGAPADVFAAASDASMRVVTEAAAGAGTPVPFVTNTLQIAVPRGNPGEVTGLQDFADAGKRLALCAEQVPCGEAARQVFQRAGITPKPDTLPADATAVLRMVQSGEVDAGLVYRTDVLAAGDTVVGIAFPGSDLVVNRYRIVRIKGSKTPDLAQRFVDHVLSAEGWAVLGEAGFGKP